MKRIDKSNYYLDIAKAVCKRSTCLRRRYGCIIVKNDTIIATGFNGSPRGYQNCTDLDVCNRQFSERYKDYDKCPAVHAEQNALLTPDKDMLKDADLYLYCEDIDGNEFTHPIPCKSCLTMIINAGINKIVTREGIIFQDKDIISQELKDECKGVLDNRIKEN